VLTGWRSATPVLSIVLAVGLLVVIVGRTTAPTADRVAPGWQDCTQFTPGTPDHNNCVLRRLPAANQRPLVIVEGRIPAELIDPSARDHLR